MDYLILGLFAIIGPYLAVWLSVWLGPRD
jgi:hypothetical protein